MARQRVRYIAPASARIAASLGGLKRRAKVLKSVFRHDEGRRNPGKGSPMDGQRGAEVGHRRKGRHIAYAFASL